ncbi:hypothetical protein ACFY9N_03930 [Microbacterium sp. NPDC008134]|uniref:hypothetical protein n=1 Tax=Microbacterium sp. NPDC008134 TaxID=3364183 RepID=UPI0036E291C6
MSGWWKARLGLLLVTGLLASFGTIFAVQSVEVVLPNLAAGSTNTFSLAYVMGFTPGLLWLIIVENRRIPLEATSTRSGTLAALDSVLVLVPPCAGYALLLVTNEPVLQGAGRNLLMIAALGLLTGIVVPRHLAFLVPVGYLLLAGTLGFSLRATDPAVWALALGTWSAQRDVAVLVIITFAAVLARAITGISTKAAARART